jgi:group II intron reverse transcriptase/maturase
LGLAQETLKEFQYNLFNEAKLNPTKKFNNLYRWLYNENILTLAWKKVKKNNGAAGVDNLTVADVEKQGVKKFINELKLELENGCYKPEVVKRVYIPKSGGKMRPIGVPTIKDRVIQTALKFIIEPIFEADFEDFSYGYRPKRSTRDACLAVYKWLDAGYSYVFDGDIDSCFDSISHEKLIKQAARRIADPYILTFIRSWLASGVLECGKIRYAKRGIPQGGVISPLLANIYLDQFDKKWKEISIDKKAPMIRYADDFIILSTELISFEQVSQTLEFLDLSLNIEKTRILRAENGFNFLGFHFKLKGDTKRIHIAPSIKSIKKVIIKIDKLTKNFQEAPDKIANEVNSILKGWINYFSITDSSITVKFIQNYCYKAVQDYLNFYNYNMQINQRENFIFFIQKR